MLGDVPVAILDVTKMRKLGWQAKYNSEEAVRIAVKNMVKK